MSDPEWLSRQKGFFDETNTASNAAQLQWSAEKLSELRPELFGISGLFYQAYVRLGQQFNEKQFITECLNGGDGRAAIVVSVAPLLVAAYSDELDAIALLRFPDHFVQQYRLQVGSRLLTINNYASDSDSKDVYPGPRNTGHWDNMIPTIADFVSDDQAQIDQLKRRISTEEWKRCYAMGLQYMQTFPGVSRDGRPFFAGMALPAAQEYERSLQRAQRFRMLFAGIGGALALSAVVCCGFGFTLVGRPRQPPPIAMAPAPEPGLPPEPVVPRPPVFSPPPVVMPRNFAPSFRPAFPESPLPQNEPTSPPAAEPQPPAQEQPVEPSVPVAPVPVIEPTPTAPASPPPEPTSKQSAPTKLKKEDSAYAQWGSRWEQVQILEVLSGQRARIRWTRWGPNWDQVVMLASLSSEPPAEGKIAAKAGFGGDGPGVEINDATPLAAGDKVFVRWFGQWSEAKVTGCRPPNLVNVRILDAADPARANMERPYPRRMLRLANEPAKPANKSAATKQPPSAAPVTSEAMRNWTDASGQFKIEARYVGLRDAAVVLQKGDGTQIEIALDKLSADDQKFVATRKANSK